MVNTEHRPWLRTAHLPHEGVAEAAEASHDVVRNDEVAEEHAGVHFSVHVGVRASDGQQDPHQQVHGDHREEAASPFLSLLLHLPE